MKSKSYSNSQIIPIVGDGAMASSDTGDGRLIPTLILNCENHKELLNLINIHEHTIPGDVTTTWGYRRFNSRYVYLVLHFKRPVEVEAVFMFDMQKQSMLADGIVQARGVYLQSNELGNSITEGLNAPKIIAEVPAPTKLKNWDEIIIKNLTKKFKMKGFSKKEAKSTAHEHLKRTRELWSKRMPQK